MAQLSTLGHSTIFIFMTPTQAAVLLLRFFSVYLCFDVMAVLTELPPSINGVFHSTVDAITTQREMVLGLELVRLLIYAIAAISFMVFSRPLAKLFTRGLESMKDDTVA